MSEPKVLLSVSVVIAAYNVEDYIARSIASVLSQTRKADEIIVIDDGSTDGTAAEIQKFGDAVRYVYQENSGVSAARNHGIRLSGHEWVAFLDSDDEWLACRLEKQLAIAEKNPELMWITGNFIRCLCNEKKQGMMLEAAKAERLVNGSNCFENYFYAFRNKAGGHTNTMLIKRDVFDKAGMFDERMNYGEDSDLWWRIAYHWPRIGYVAKPLAIYHLTRPATLSKGSTDKQIRTLIGQLEKHLALAEQYGQMENFRPLASFLVRSWIRGLLFTNQPELVRDVMSKFGYLLGFRFRILGRIAMRFPSGTATVCHAISKCVRALSIRKEILRRPRRKVKE